MDGGTKMRQKWTPLFEKKEKRGRKKENKNENTIGSLCTNWTCQTGKIFMWGSGRHFFNKGSQLNILKYKVL